ncbi:ATP-grasp domain-containing protein [Paraclostridium sordellii]|uniref:ATP-grasp domain-containing protein n=1 Tax=Paraclostridium sordellii TaxID=1505 RepID=UPI0005E8712E|nr:ATP-grasp domain-containing protein [Paeniclostridium sordellii]CEN83647.1 carbamoyl phosphate synthase-like protein [[Clostridium] sordellii] [Paeniclostridium sordellii]CEQ23246.1 carbamoyl phosphate synthase-like protein [[Clostridium] sordellii] [Paeniclostridium sordellii]
MNFLILSSGRRTKLIEYFVKEFKGFGNIIVTDCDSLAPTLYIADKGYIVPRIDDANYINEIKEICKKENINGLISLIDPELSLISKYEKIFNEIGVKCFLSKYDVTEICFNKYKMFKFLENNSFKTAKSFIDFKEFKEEYENGKIKFPVFIKPICGSASININKINTLSEVEFLMNKYEGLIIQEFLDGQELGIDVYTDMLTGEVISIFAKEKIRMRSGETDKSKSIKCEKLFSIIESFVKKLGTRGPIDIDVFRIEGEYYISEVNPRFGGGHPHAYECGENFMKFIQNNLVDIENKVQIGNYEDDVYMIKHDTLNIIRHSDMEKLQSIK